MATRKVKKGSEGSTQPSPRQQSHSHSNTSHNHGHSHGHGHHKPKSVEEEKLIHEVTDFITTERKYLEKQVQEKKKESEDWHTKYAELVDKVSHTAGWNGDCFTLEAASGSDINEPITNVPKSTIDRVLEQTSIMNLSDTEYSPKLLSMALEELRKTRSIDVHQTLLLRNAELQDNSFPVLSNFLSYPMLVAVDLSYNLFTTEFFTNFTTLLQNRKKTPQYVLLHGNVHLVNHDHAPLLSTFLHSLTSQTWGISISCTDLKVASPHVHEAEGDGHHPPGSTIKKKAKSGVDASLLQYAQDKSDNPMLCNQFVHLLGAILDPTKHSHHDTKSKGKSSTKVKAGHGGRPEGNGLRTLTVLGLTNAYLSRHTVQALKVVLNTCIATLTDLDLSFAYTGYDGATVLASILSNPACQLIKIGLAGNALGEYGVQQISHGVQVNESLTNLDLRSNGLRDGNAVPILIDASCRRGSVLNRLDLRGNHLPEAIVHQCKNRIHDAGGRLTVLWNVNTFPRNSSYNELFRKDRLLASGVGEMFYPNGRLSFSRYLNPDDKSTFPRVLYRHESKEIALIQTGYAQSLVYRVDIRHLNAHYSSHYKQAVEFCWNIRPIVRDTNDLQSFRRSVQGQRVDPPAYGSVASNDASQLENDVLWELRSTSGRLDQLETFVIDSGVVPRAATVAGPLLEIPWSLCRSTIRSVPLTGCIELWVGVRSATSLRNAAAIAVDTTLSFARMCKISAVECKGLIVRNIPPAGVAFAGGDCIDWSPAVQTKLSLDALERCKMLSVCLSVCPSNHKILRAMQWHGSKVATEDKGPVSHSIAWQAKLIALNTTGSSQDAARPSAPPDNSNGGSQLHLIGFDWSVIIIRRSGSSETIRVGNSTEGTEQLSTQSVLENEGQHQDSPPLRDRVNGPGDILASWQWRCFEVLLPANLQSGDRIVITGTPALLSMSSSAKLIENQMTSTIVSPLDAINPTEKSSLVIRGCELREFGLCQEDSISRYSSLLADESNESSLSATGDVKKSVPSESVQVTDVAQHHQFVMSTSYDAVLPFTVHNDPSCVWQY